MAAFGKWLVGAVLGWLVDWIRGLVEQYLERKRKEREREEDNKRAEEKLEKAETEAEIIDAGADHLRR
jgi:hypothetical protein